MKISKHKKGIFHDREYIIDPKTNKEICIYTNEGIKLLKNYIKLFDNKGGSDIVLKDKLLWFKIYTFFEDDDIKSCFGSAFTGSSLVSTLNKYIYKNILYSPYSDLVRTIELSLNAYIEDGGTIPNTIENIKTKLVNPINQEEIFQSKVEEIFEKIDKFLSFEQNPYYMFMLGDRHRKKEQRNNILRYMIYVDIKSYLEYDKFLTDKVFVSVVNKFKKIGLVLSSDIPNKKDTQIIVNRLFPSEPVIYNSKKQLLVKKLSGIVSLHYYKINDKKILLFGDVHLGNQGLCTTSVDEPNYYLVDQYVKELLKSKPKKCFDLYLETYFNLADKSIYAQNTFEQTGGYMENFRINFGDVFIKKQLSNKYRINFPKNNFNNVRFNSFDLRLMENKHPIMQLFILGPKIHSEIFLDPNKVNELYVFLKKVSDENYPRKMFYFITGFPHGEYLKNGEEIIKNIFKILNLEKFYDNKGVKLTRAFIQKSYSKCDMEIRDLLINKYLENVIIDFKSIIMKIQDVNSRNKDKVFYIFQDFIAVIFTLISDLYLLMKLFSKFDRTPEKNSRTPSGCPLDLYDEPKNIIVYGGDLHINRISRILNEIKIPDIQKKNISEQDILDFDKIQRRVSQGEKVQCVTLDFPIDFFPNDREERI